MRQGVKGWLSRSPDGRYVFSRQQPVLAKISGTDCRGLYPVVGDAFFTGLEKTMCESWCRMHGIDLNPCESVQCAFSMELLSDPISLGK